MNIHLRQFFAVLTLFAAVVPVAEPGAHAALPDYDQVVEVDAAGGLPFVARLVTPAVLTGANRVAFDFGANSGDATFEFILQGNPAATTGSSYLAVGTNTGSNLRYNQYQNTGQLGFTQLGVLDYLFSPAVQSPSQATHVVYTWSEGTRTMKLFTNGVLAGTRSGVNTNWAMPYGVGWLGGNPNNTELMVGTIHRVTVYDDLLSDEVIQRHSDAYNGIVRPPVISAFTCNTPVIFTPDSATLSWVVRNATWVSINGLDVTSASNLTVSPLVTTIYVLTATNLGGSISRQLKLLVNPAPTINTFNASSTYIVAGQAVDLTWDVSYGAGFLLEPEPGDVSFVTTNGVGALRVTPAPPVTYLLRASNSFGVTSRAIEFFAAHPAQHLVITEFMADDDSTLADEDGAHTGWIELYNPTAASIGLGGYFLTDDPADPTKWAFPSLQMPSASYLVVFASGKDRTNTTGPLHANFELRNEGEYLALVGPGPVLLQAFAPVFPPQRRDISYGLLAADPGLLRYFGVATPGAANQEIAAPPWPVRFSKPSGLFSDSFELSLSSADTNAQILFTLDGSAPDALHGMPYTGPVVITNTTRIRAVAVVSGQVSRPEAGGYIKLAPELAGYTSPLPILLIENFGAGVIPQKGWSGNGAGIIQVPRQAAVWATFDRVWATGSLTNAPQMFSQVDIRGRGAYSTQWRQKPYSVQAVNDSGDEVDVSPLGLPAHADWVLYFPDPDQNKDPALLFNTFAYELSANMGHYAARFRWVEAFVHETGGELRLSDRRGVYAIIEKISRGRDRLDFTRLSADGTTGSWLLNINRMDPEPETGWPAPNGAIQPWFFHTAGANRILETPPNSLVVGDDQPQQINGFLNFDNPNGYNINTNQRAAIENWFKQFEDVLYDNTRWKDPVGGYGAYIDTLDFVDYFALNVLTRNGDGLLISLFPWKGDDGKLRIGPAWDYNWNAYYVSGGPTGSLMHRSERLWYARLFTDPDFLQLYIDRWWELRRGPLANLAMEAIVDRQAADITLSESVLNGMPSGLEWSNRLAQMKTWLKQRADWIDSNYLRPPVFNQNGGIIPEGFLVVLTGANGSIYFTTDGSDPRAPGGSESPSAQLYQRPFPIQGQTLVQARIKNGANWSGLSSALFYTPQDLSGLAVTEIMYNPPAFGGWSGEDLEFIELKNKGSTTLHLGALAFSGIEFAFTNGTMLGPGQFLVLARNALAFQARYPGVPLSGVYTGKLDNAGETIRLATPFGATVFSFTYNDRAPWPLTADGYGFSLVPRSSATPPNSDYAGDWRASASRGGSPGADDPTPAGSLVLINEILSHTDPPTVDAIELYNPAAEPADVSGWFLSDDGTVPKKFCIPAETIIPSGGFQVFTEADFNPTPGTLLNFALDSAGDAIYLVAADAGGNFTGHSHGVDFGAAALGVSFGRHVNSVGEEQFPAQLERTLGSSNSAPAVGPIVVTEIMYHPAPGGEEYIELRNVTSEDIPLCDPSNPTNTWRINGLGFAFPAGVIVPSNGVLIVSGLSPEEFRARHSLASEVLVFGPFAGTLQDNGERLELQRPEVLDTNGWAYITVDEVRYSDSLPWPPAAGGIGASLQRIEPAAYGNDPANWRAALPTPGVEFASGQGPVLTQQPQSQTLVAYQDTVFSVAASGPGPLYYQWLFQEMPLDGQTNSTLQLTNVQIAQAGAYSAIVFNAAGSAVSAAARLYLLMPPLIVQQPHSITTNAGRTVTFSISAFGTGVVRYQWRLNGQNIDGATNATLTLTNSQLSQTGVYDVTATDDIATVISARATLELLVDLVIVQQPLSQAVVAGSTVTLSVAVTNTANLPVGYRWRRNAGTITNMVLNERSSFLTITNAQWPYTNYTVVLTNKARAGGLLSSPAILTFVPDTDGDGLPDPWEIRFGLDLNSASDRDLDSDGDKMLNWQEYVAGTDPTDPSSCLRIQLNPAGGATVSFEAISNRTYSVEWTDSLATGAWGALADLFARPTNITQVISDPYYTTNRFYRVVTPTRLGP